LEGYAIAATKNQVFEAILIMMLRSLQAISRAFFMINLPSRVSQTIHEHLEKESQEVRQALDEYSQQAAQKGVLAEWDCKIGDAGHWISGQTHLIFIKKTHKEFEALKIVQD
jgi:hypothetical protein